MFIKFHGISASFLILYSEQNTKFLTQLNMLMCLICITAVTLLPTILSTRNACVPNTQFVLNGKMCFCDNQGWWNESFCVMVGRRTCLPGQLVWQGCNKCVCQENGKLLCSNAGCFGDTTHKTGVIASTKNTLDSYEFASSWCTPFKSYYVNCSMCVCTASGRASEAHCVTDNSCQHLSISKSDLLSVNNNVCIPRVVYLFQCLQCMCSDEGHFILEKCVEMCHLPQQTETTRRCISNTFYRKNCNVCWCPGDSVADDKLCTQVVCNKQSKFRSLESLRGIRSKCRPNSFLKPKCFYCTCNTNGNMNENACLELDCLKTKDFNFDVAKSTCSPGEMVPICTECFCVRNGVTNKSYCSDVCSYKSKLVVLEKILKEKENNKLIEKDNIERTSEDDNCIPNSVYLDQGRYCLCSENGTTNFRLCTSVFEDEYVTKLNSVLPSNTINESLNITCTPNTFVEVDCNTCYCAKNGKVDPKWCTYDDCQAKRVIQTVHKTSSALNVRNSNDTCVPGTITKIECNFCICPESGYTKDWACTKNKCSKVQPVEDVTFICEPLAYYLVDCNICLCPRDGIKNVEKCTKNICEKTILRSDNCLPGQFFSNDCNVCVCPPNGDKADRACTRHTCSDSETPWKKIYRMSQTLLENRSKQAHANTREIEVCFSGEEFEVGCKLCVCSDVGLRSYATCSDEMCKGNDGEDNNNTLNLMDTDMLKEGGSEVAILRSKRNSKKKFYSDKTQSNIEENCFIFNLTDSSERKDCTPGSMYIIRCKQCICPYMGNINLFCRGLALGTYCEQPYPGFNYHPMGRRIPDGKNDTSTGTTEIASTTETPEAPVPHDHTPYNCTRPGKIMDDCFICECEERRRIVIKEHCFHSDAKKCVDAKPTFLDDLSRAVIEP